MPLQEWNQIVVQIGKTGRSSLKQRVSAFDVDRLPIAVAARVKDILSKLNLDEVRDVSSGAATFYVWVGSATNHSIYVHYLEKHEKRKKERKKKTKRKNQTTKQTNHLFGQIIFAIKRSKYLLGYLG